MSTAGAPLKPYSGVETNLRVLELAGALDLATARVVDVGAGEGYFARELGERVRRTSGLPPDRVVHACDLHPEQFQYPAIRCDRVDLGGELPYPEGSFDAACCIEVIEHVEDQFHLVRELHRILKPGGRAIVTTPNVLNVNSRLRYFFSGFGLLFDPLPLRRRDPVHLGGHIHPISFYYLAYAFHRAGFREVRLHFDRVKKSGVFWLIPFGLPILVASALHRLRLRWRDRALFEENRALLSRMSGVRMLTARTIIVEGVR